MKRLVKWLGLAGATLAMIACTTMESLPTDKAQLQRKLHPGDTVDLSKTDGGRLHFDIDHIDSAGLHTPGLTVPFSDIKTISREQTSWWKTGLLALGAVAAGVIIASGAKGGGGSHSGGW